MIIYCDGGSRGNPGPAASAFVVTSDEKVIFKEGKYLGIETNNVAEYTAVILALDWIINNNVSEEIIFNLDSQLIERQINGFYKVKNERLKELHDKAIKLTKSINTKISFKWNYRTDNEIADNLVNETLDMVASTGK